MNEKTDFEKDRETIERLHEKDMNVSKAGDYETLRSLMTDDAVMPPGGDFVRGGAALDASLSRMKEAMSQVEALEYVEEFEEVMILGNYAVGGESSGARSGQKTAVRSNTQPTK